MYIEPVTRRLGTGDTCSFRSLAAKDAVELISFEKEIAQQTHFMVRYVNEITVQPKEEARIIRNVIENPHEAMIGAFIKNHLVGLVKLKVLGEYRKVHHRASFSIAVLKAYQGKRIASILMDTCFSAAKKMGVTQLELEVACTNRQALYLYRNQGFLIYGTRKRAYKLSNHSYLDEYLMYKVLEEGEGKMIQDIAPHAFYNEFEIHEIEGDDYVIAIKDNDVYLDGTDGQIKFPTYNDVKNECSDITKYSYLFKVDETRYFLYDSSTLKETGSYQYTNWNVYRDFGPMHSLLAASVGSQISRFYTGHTYCGQCGSKTVRSTKERAVICMSCNKTVYPTISPSVIVAITYKDQLLLTKYAYGPYKKYALVAGYSEVGESMEQTVRREVMEEVGLAVKNIRYYKSQPWPCSDAMLMGYFVEVDGDPTITLQEEELKEGTWFQRDSIPETTSTISLTNEMIEYFRNHPEEFN